MSQARREVPTEGAFGAAIESLGKRKCSERASDTVTLCEPGPCTPHTLSADDNTHTPSPPRGGPGPQSPGPGALSVCFLHWANTLLAPSTVGLLPEPRLICPHAGHLCTRSRGPLPARPDHPVEARGVAGGDGRWATWGVL